jgi:predicted nucleic acid-binding protein
MSSSDFFGEFERLGVADAAILCIANRCQGVLLTDDHKLFQALQAGSRFRMLLLDDVIDEE